MEAGSPASAFARHPDLLRGPLPAPLDGDVVVIDGRARLRVRLELDEMLVPETVCAQETDPVAVCEVELRSGLTGPLHPVHPELRPLELLGLRAHGRRRQ